MNVLLAAFSYTPIEKLGPVSPHGVGTAVGFLLGAVLMARRAEPRGIPRAEVYNAVTWGAIGALIGARGFYVLGHTGQFHSIADVLAVWQGGLTMFGGFFGGLVLGLGYLKRNGFNVVQALDAAAPGFAVGVIVGRIGDMIIADHLGRTTSFFAGYRIPDAQLAPGYGPPIFAPGVVVHHTAMYDLIGAAALLVFLYRLQRHRLGDGSLFAAFAIWYGLERFLLDFTRNRELIEAVFFGLSGSQWSGLAFAAGGLYALRRIRARGEDPAPFPVSAGPVELADARPAVAEPELSPPPAAWLPPAPTTPPTSAPNDSPGAVPGDPTNDQRS